MTSLPPDSSGSRPTEPFLQRVRVRNYKSIEKCDIRLHPLTLLVGRNGAGKSNFLDALRFVADGLQTSLDHAVKARGGIDSVRRRSTGHPRNFAIQLTMNHPDWHTTTYGFEVAAREKGRFAVKREVLRRVDQTGELTAHYDVKEATVLRSSEEHHPPASPDRLYLVAASSIPAFRPTYDALLSMGFYNLNPEAMKELQSPDAGDLLHRDGGNIASVVARLSMDNGRAKERIQEYLQTIVPGISDVSRTALGPKETLEFRQEVKGAAHPWQFYANSMSDGTLRALGALVAVAQLADRSTPVRLVGIEEPETALHPAATAALMDALRDAVMHTQVLITTHSADLIDKADPDEDGLLAVASRHGVTGVAPLDHASIRAIKDHLYSPGDLLRMEQLEPSKEDLLRQEQLTLFQD